MHSTAREIRLRTVDKQLRIICAKAPERVQGGNSREAFGLEGNA